jgi:hypothetical protein
VLIAPSVRESDEFISKMANLPKDASKVRTKNNHIFLKKLAVSLRHLLQGCFTALLPAKRNLAFATLLSVSDLIRTI